MELRAHFFAESLGQNTHVTVLLPTVHDEVTDARRVRQGPPPVLYLLHGAGGDSTSWARRSSIERYAEAHGIAVVMPEVGLSFYTDEAHGYGYATYVAEELPAVVARSFVVATEREDTFIAGLSMGGYGAMTIALNHPERFAAAASLSGALDLGAAHWRDRDPRVRDRVWGEALPSVNQLPVELVATGDVARFPRLFVGCGDDDDLYDDSVAFVRAAERAGANLTSDFVAGYGHRWDFWDMEIQKILDWLPLR